MRHVTRRRFLQGSAAAGGATVGARFLFGGTETLVARADGVAQQVVEDVVRTTCWIGKQDCGIVARRVNGRVVRLDGEPANPRNLGRLCPKGVAQILSVYDPNRVKSPLIRTNEKGRSGAWRRATWEEAIALVAQRVNEVRERNPKLVLWQKGRSKSDAFYDDAFVKSIGATKMGHGGYCSDAGYRAAEYTIGVKGVLHPDIRHSNLIISWGWNITAAGGNKLCWITWPRELADARARGAKVVQIDPRLRSAGPHADRWLPIRPGTDLALALAIANVLVEQGFVDRPYLSRFTNAASLVGSDGHVLKVGDVEQVWDLATGSASSLADAADPALEGDFEVDGGAVRPAFEVFKADIRQYTPDWAARICGLDAADIRWLAEEMGTQARIGAETVVNGLTIPYRPVGIMAYHVAQQELGFQYVRGVLLVTMLLGSLGAVGGTGIDFSWKIADNFEKLDQVEIKDPPYDFMLKDSKYFPINTGLPGITAKVMIDPERYGVEDLPEVAILHMVNPLSSFPDRSVFIEAWKKLKFVAVISPWMSETADFFADVVLPAATMEKYEGPLKADDLYSEAITLRQPVMDPLFESRGEIDIYLDLADAIGVLTGDEGYVAHVNEALDLEDEPLPTDVRPEVRDIFDRWARAQGVEDGVAYFEEHGVKNKGDRPPEKMYGYVTDPPFGGVTHRFFGESLLRYRDEMEAKGAEETYWRDYTPLPVWRTPTLEGSPSEYDLYLISYKLVEHKQSRSSFNAMLAELTPRQRVDINPRTARRLGVDDGELVWVESQNAVTGETRRVRVHAAFTEAIRPDTVGMPHHFGLWVHPASQGMGPSPNEIYYTGEGYVTNTADQSYLVKVRVYPAGGEA